MFGCMRIETKFKKISSKIDKWAMMLCGAYFAACHDKFSRNKPTQQKKNFLPILAHVFQTH
jgi:hypothetical protein